MRCLTTWGALLVLICSSGVGEPCTRFRIAREMLADPGFRPTVDGLRGILSATHLEFQTPTVLSSICNLSTGEIHLNYFHDFERVKVLDLGSELAQGGHGWLLSGLFSPQPFVATVYENFSRRFGG